MHPLNYWVGFRPIGQDLSHALGRVGSVGSDPVAILGLLRSRVFLAHLIGSVWV